MVGRWHYRQVGTLHQQTPSDTPWWQLSFFAYYKIIVIGDMSGLRRTFTTDIYSIQYTCCSSAGPFRPATEMQMYNIGTRRTTLTTITLRCKLSSDVRYRITIILLFSFRLICVRNFVTLAQNGILFYFALRRLIRY